MCRCAAALPSARNLLSRNLAQFKEYISAAGHKLTGADEAFVDGMVAPGHFSTPNFIDPRYPPTGRKPRNG